MAFSKYGETVVDLVHPHERLHFDKPSMNVDMLITRTTVSFQSSLAVYELIINGYYNWKSGLNRVSYILEIICRMAIIRLVPYDLDVAEDTLLGIPLWRDLRWFWEQSDDASNINNTWWLGLNTRQSSAIGRSVVQV